MNFDFLKDVNIIFVKSAHLSIIGKARDVTYVVNRQEELLILPNKL